MSAAPRTVALAACPTGGHVRLRAAFEAHDRVHGVPGRYRYDACDDCGTVFQNPRVATEDLGRCYPSDYYDTLADADEPPASGARAGVRGWLAGAVRRAVAHPSQAPLLARALASSRLLRERAFAGLPDALIPRGGTPGRALDAGCGAGRLLLLLARAGWDAEGLEWGAAAAARARASSGRPVTVGDFFGAALPAGAFDLVVLHHVLEHLPDPVASVARAAELLAPGGTVVFVYPNARALGARVFGASWYPWEVPRHLVFPSRAALAEMARGAGLAPVRVRTVAGWSAPYLLAASRALAAGRPAAGVRAGVRDHAWAAVERVLCAVGVPVGEEIVAAFARGTA
ncbi:MAG: class I SAM-dependent methyltransferase [Vicinamibacteria bacterium]